MDFGKITSMAKQFAGDSQPADQQQTNNQSSDQKWSDVGSSAKKAFEDYQTSQKEGKAVDYKELGEVAQKAAGAYQSGSGEKPDLTKIGKGLAAGFLGGSEPRDAPAPAAQQDADADANKPAEAANEQQQEKPAEEMAQGHDAQPVDGADQTSSETGSTKNATPFGISQDQATSFISNGLKGFGN